MVDKKNPIYVINVHLAIGTRDATLANRMHEALGEFVQICQASGASTRGFAELQQYTPKPDTDEAEADKGDKPSNVIPITAAKRAPDPKSN